MTPRLMLAAAVFVLSAVGGYSQQPSTESDVLSVHEARYQAMIRNDPAALDQLFAEEFRYCHSTGRFDTKASYLEYFRDSPLRFVGLTDGNRQVQMSGDSAIVLSELHLTIKTSGTADSRPLVHRTVEAYAKRGGRWLMTYYQATSLPAPSVTAK